MKHCWRVMVVVVISAVSGFSQAAASKNPFSLLLVSTFPGSTFKGLTGLDRYVFNYAVYLQKSNQRVTVLLQDGSVLKKPLTDAGVTCYTWPFHTKKLKPGQLPFKEFIEALIAERGITHVHCNQMQELHKLGPLLHTCRVPLFYTHHFQRTFKPESCKYLAGVCVVDKQHVQRLENGRKHQRVPMMFIPPFLDEEALLGTAAGLLEAPVRNPVPVIAMVGNMYNAAGVKNYPLLIDAVERLIHHYQEPCKVVIVGDGPARKQIEKLVKDKKLEALVQFLGFRHDAPSILGKADIAVLTSKQEGFGMVLAEACMLGKPVIGPDNTGVVGVIEAGVNGYLFKNGSLDDFCLKCLKLLKNPIERAAMGQRAQAYAMKHFTNESVFARMRQLYGLC